VGVGIKVEVGRGRGVDEAVAGCASGTNRVGMNDSDVGVATVPHKDGDCLQEVNNKAAMNSIAMKRLTWNPYQELYLCKLNP
jgi:hypothetical protein